MNKNSKIAVGYVRLSADDSKNPSLSPTHQRKFIMDYAKQNGDQIIEFYEDINRTGSNLERPEFKRMLEDAKKDKFAKIYMKDWSRLTRDTVDLRKLRKQILEELKIDIISTDGIKDDKAVDVTTLSSEWFIRECRKNQQKTHKLKLQERIPCSRPPFGYRMSKKLKKFVIKEEEAEEVRKIFQMKKDGISINKIAKEVNMCPSKVFTILHNKTYMGYIKYKDRIIKGCHEPLISEELFEGIEKFIYKSGYTMY